MPVMVNCSYFSGTLQFKGVISCLCSLALKVVLYFNPSLSMQTCFGCSLRRPYYLLIKGAFQLNWVVNVNITQGNGTGG